MPSSYVQEHVKTRVPARLLQLLNSNKHSVSAHHKNKAQELRGLCHLDYCCSYNPENSNLDTFIGNLTSSYDDFIVCSPMESAQMHVGIVTSDNSPQLGRCSCLPNTFIKCMSFRKRTNGTNLISSRCKQMLQLILFSVCLKAQVFCPGILKRILSSTTLI